MVSSSWKFRANGRNIVGQQLPTLLDVTCCVRLHTLLHVVEQSWNWLNFSANNSQLFQHCWGHARSLRMVYVDLWVVSFPGTNIAGRCCIRLHTTANTHATTSNIVGATMLGVVAFARSLTCEKSSIPTGLFLYTNMAAVTSCENRKSGNWVIPIFSGQKPLLYQINLNNIAFFFYIFQGLKM